MEKEENSLVENILDRIVDILEWIAVVCLIGIVLIIVLQITFRNIFFVGIHWAEETTRFLHISLIFLVIPILQNEKKILTVTYMVDRFPFNWQNLVKNFALAICIAFSILFIMSFYLFMQKAWNVVTPDLRMPNLIFYFSSLIGFLCFILVAIKQLSKRIKSL